MKYAVNTINGYVKKATMYYIYDIFIGGIFYDVEYTKDIKEAKAYKRKGMAYQMSQKWFDSPEYCVKIEVVE